MSVTIKDIAREAGVSFSTVSSVLRSPDYQGGSASAVTRKKIVSIARSLNYQPSNIARGLRTGKSRLIAFLSSTFEAGLVVEAMIGAENVCHRNDYNILLGTFDSPLSYRSILGSLLRKRVDGILVSYLREREYQEILGEFSRKVPIVNVFGASSASCPGVYVDGAKIGRLAAEYLLGLGHRRILITGERPYACEAFRETFLAAGLPAEDLLHWPHFKTFEDGTAVMDELLLQKMPVTAIYAYNDQNAAGILQQAVLRGVQVPADLSVIGSDNYGFCPMLSPPMTTIAQPQREQGSEAAEMLLQMIEKGEPISEDRVLSPYLIIRNSCRDLNLKPAPAST